MQKGKDKIEEAPEALKLLSKWIFLITGVPTLTYVFLATSIKYTFEISTTRWQIFIGITLVMSLILYVYLSIKYLISETKTYFSE